VVNDQKLSQPTITAYHDLLRDMAQYFDASPERVKAEFLDPLMKNWPDPASLTSDWWTSQLDRATKASPLDRQRIINKLGNLSLLQEQRKQLMAEIARDPQNFQRYQEVRRNQEVQAYENEIRSAAEDLFAGQMKHLAEWRDKPLDGVTDPHRLEELKKHNARFQNLQNTFSDVIRTFNSGGRGACKVAMEYIEMSEKVKEIPELTKENEELRARVAKLTGQVVAKRKLSDGPLRSMTPRPLRPAKETTPLPKDSRGSLGKAFDDWKT
jgi:hypothetical protein